MDIKKLAADIAFVFIITFLASVIVTYLYSFIVHAGGRVDWETAFRLSIIFGIVLPLVRQREKK